MARTGPTRWRHRLTRAEQALVLTRADETWGKPFTTEGYQREAIIRGLAGSLAVARILSLPWREGWAWDGPDVEPDISVRAVRLGDYYLQVDAPKPRASRWVKVVQDPDDPWLFELTGWITRADAEAVGLLVPPKADLPYRPRAAPRPNGRWCATYLVADQDLASPAELPELRGTGTAEQRGRINWRVQSDAKRTYDRAARARTEARRRRDRDTPLLFPQPD